MKRKVLVREGAKIRNLNRRRAIRHHCRMCCDFDWQAVIDCEKETCPLHAYRLGGRQAGELNPRDRAAAIGRYCLHCSGDDAAKRDQCEARECALYPYREGAFQ